MRLSLANAFEGMCALAAALKNRLIESLPPEVKSSLLSKLEPVPLPVGQVLFEPHETAPHVHFVTSGMVSLTTTMSEGTMVEVGLSGPEGFPQSLQLLGPERGPKRCFVQIAGTALRMPFKRFEQEFLASTTLQRAVLQLVQYESLALAQMAACNRLHEAEERLARWLLMVEDRINDEHMTLTQEFLAQMLGIRRSSVTVAAATLQKAGWIEYHRGDIRILNREALKDVACECYSIIERMYNGLYR
jgi:CRP-like cAMP-binding protein